jgi:hypothetical protein
MKFFLTLFCCFLFVSGRSQDTIFIVSPVKRTIYGEAFGQSLFYSINYDQLLRYSEISRTSFTVGGTIIPTRELGVYAGSGSYNLLIGKRKHFFELGIGLSAMYMVNGNIGSSVTITDQNGVMHDYQYMGYEKDFFLYLTPKIGYRFQQPDGGFFTKVTFTPAVGIFSYYGPLIEYGSGMIYNNHSYFYLFQEAAFFGSIAYPWAGISVGHSF